MTVLYFCVGTAQVHAEPDFGIATPTAGGDDTVYPRGGSPYARAAYTVGTGAAANRDGASCHI